MPKALTDADLMKGGLGGTDDGGTGDDKGKKGGAPADDGKGGGAATVNVGGVEFPAEIGDKLQTLVQGFTREIDHLKGQVQTLSTVQQPAPKKGAKEEEDDDDDINTRLFENPKETINKVLSKFEKKIAGMIAESVGKADAKHMAADQEKEFWGLFYGDNPELKEHDFLARAVLNRDFAKLGSKSVDEALKHIATEVKKIVLKAPKAGADDPKNKSRGVEGSGGRPGAGKKEDGDDGDEPKVEAETLSAFIKSRRAARRAGATKGA